MLTRAAAICTVACLIFYLRKPGDIAVVVEEVEEETVVREYPKFSGWGTKGAPAGRWDKREATSVDPLEAAERRLGLWLRQNGGMVEGTTLKEEKGRRGLHASRDHRRGEVLAKVPRGCIITVEMGMATPAGAALLHIEALIPHFSSGLLYLVLFLFEDYFQGQSFFAPYYELLPLQPTELPLLWTDAERERHSGTKLLERVDSLRRRLERTFNDIVVAYPPLSARTLEEFLWAWATVSSRALAVFPDDEEQGSRSLAPALVPHADLLDDSDGASATVLLKEGDLFYALHAASDTPTGIRLLRPSLYKATDPLFLPVHGLYTTTEDQAAEAI